MKKLLIGLVLLFVCSLQVFAEEPFSVEITVPETFMLIQEYGEAFFNVKITNRQKAADFKVEYTRKGFDFDYDGGRVYDCGTYSIGDHSSKIIRVDNNLPKGSYFVAVKVTCGEKTVETQKRIAVMESYERQFADKYTRIAVTTGNVGNPVVDNAHWRNFKNILLNNVTLLNKTGVLVERASGSASLNYKIENGEMLPGEGLDKYYNESIANPWLSTPINVDGEPAITRERKQVITKFIQDRVKYQMHKTWGFMCIGNEPDLSKYFKGSDKYGIQYLNVMRNSVFAMRDVSEDYDIMGGGVCASVNAQGFLEYMFRQDAYKYLDGYDYHPYTNSLVDDSYDSKVVRYENAANHCGGWLQKRITEVGFDGYWEPSVGQLGTAQLATEGMKLFLKGYQHNVDLTEYYSLCNNCGLQPINDFSVASEGIAALSNICKMLNAAVYVGEFPMADGSICLSFVRDGEPLMAVWMPGETPIEYTFKNDVEVDDMYGNTVYKGKTVNIDDQIVYIRNIDKDYIYETAKAEIEKTYAKIEKEYGEKFNTEIFSDIKAWTADDIKNDPSGALKANYDTGDKLLSEYLSGKTTLEMNELTSSLFEIELAAEKLVGVHIMGSKSASAQISQKYKQVRQQLDARKNGEKHAILLYTDKIMRYSYRFYRTANDLQSAAADKMQAPFVSGYSYMSERLAAWAERIMPLEEVDDTIGLLTQCTPVQYNFYRQDKSVTIDYSIDNRRITPLSGEIRIINGSGEQLGNSIPVELGKNGYRELKLEIPNGYNGTDGEMYKVQVWEKGKLMNEQWFPVTYQKTLDAELANATTVFSGLSDVGVKLTNNTPSEVKGRVTVIPPEGWVMAESTKSFTLSDSEIKTVRFNISEKQQKQFNIYSFTVKVELEDGTVLLDKKLPLNFSVAIETTKEYSVENFDGSIDDWQNAYPLFANAPNDPDSAEEWHDSNVASISYLKYDKNYFYILANVYDNVFHGKYTGTASWNNDSIQMLIDTMADGSKQVGPDDYKYTIAYNKNGYEFIVTAGSNVNTDLNDEGKALMVIRDDAKKITRYIMKIPFSKIAPLSGETYTKFRINMVFNDSDLEDRQKMIQITKGLGEGGSGVSPAKYYEYTMYPYEAAAEPDDGGIIDRTMADDKQYQTAK